MVSSNGSSKYSFFLRFQIAVGNETWPTDRSMYVCSKHQGFPYRTCIRQGRGQRA